MKKKEKSWQLVAMQAMLSADEPKAGEGTADYIVRHLDDLRKHIYCYLQMKLQDTSKDKKMEVDVRVDSDREDLCEEARIDAAYMYGNRVYVDIDYSGSTTHHVPLEDIRVEWQVELVKNLNGEDDEDD
jgi:hypothetical protein